MTKIRTILNMNYIEDIYAWFKENKNCVVPFQVPVNDKVVYCLTDYQRPSVKSLCLYPTYKRQSVLPRLFGNDIFVTLSFRAKNKPTVYCSWIEPKPYIICMWQCDVTNGITQDCFKSIDTDFQMLTQKDKTTNDKNMDLQMLTRATKSMSNISNMELIHQIFKVMYTIVAPIILMDDLEYDPSGVLLFYRQEFHILEEQFDILLITSSNYARNMNKELMSKFTCDWEYTLTTVFNFPIIQSLPIHTWISVVWLQVIGCPHIIHSEQDLIYLLCEIILSRPFHTQEEITESLKKAGFRETISYFISHQIMFNINDFNRQLRELSEPISWNSFLVATKISETSTPYVEYTYSHHLTEEESESKKEIEKIYTVVQPTKLKLSVIKKDHSQENITAVPLNWGNKDWYPRDFTKSVFDYIQLQLKMEINSTKCFFGHCTTEQNIVKMSKYGMSPYAGYQNPMSCGRGMYFFKLSKTEFTFLELTQKAERIDNSKLGKEFQGFLYAVTRCFNNGIFASSAAVLLFMVQENDFPLVDSTKYLLPLQKDCKCPNVILDDKNADLKDLKSLKICHTEELVSLSDIKRALGMIDTTTPDGIEKFNAFAVLSGVIDMDSIGFGFSGNICDSIVLSVNIPSSSLKSWNSQKEFTVWKSVISAPMSTYRRPILSFDDYGNFMHVSPCDIKYPTKWEQSYINEQNTKSAGTEIVFVSEKSLENLLNKGSTSVCFIDPEFVARNDKHTCHKEDYEICGNILTMETVENQVFANTIKAHPYWFNRLRCQINHGTEKTYR